MKWNRMYATDKKNLSKSKKWYLTRNTGSIYVKCWNASTTEITKHHGCLEYKGNGSRYNYKTFLHYYYCHEYFGHCPKPEKLMYVEKQSDGTWSVETITLAFSKDT